MSVSLESWTPLLHEEVAQVPFTHAAVMQSAPSEHFLLLSQRGQVVPPQSTSVSAPFFVPSVQPTGGAWHTAPICTNPASQLRPHFSPKHAALPCSVAGQGLQEGSAHPFSGSASVQRPAHSFS